ncbi:WNT1-inducible-signaling pathway protein 1 [Oryzias melastigma]|uniref:CCN family member 4 n=1 Tax=Oryzias melastigma TaxID=30732 RepID=A0A834F403_ORYME|nr:WNT1-inducible-signaling pathway protein 1 [Oryzias melastigma]
MRGLLLWILTAAGIQQAYPLNSTAMPSSTAFTPPPTDPYNRTRYCKWPCECPEVPPKCPPGVSLLTDGCECCKACARQVGEVCNEADTCDFHKGLYCDYSSDKPRYEKGVCAYMVGTGCEHNGVIYHNGQSFQPSCKYQCVCVNGAIGCVSLCTESQPPRVWCQNPRTHQSPGPVLLCIFKQLSIKRILIFIYLNSFTCKIVILFLVILLNFSICVDSALPAKNRSWHNNCISQTTSWSPCSKTCGRGLSMRISNANDQCAMVKESRLCNLRPCEVDITKHIKPGKKCLNIYREDQPQNLTISGCTSKKQYRPKYCGVCTDERCCIPYKSKTIDVEFECP